MEWHADSNRGGRSENEDAIKYTVPDDQVNIRHKGILLIVCDGVGGEEGGQIAARVAIRAAFQTYYADPSSDPQLAMRAAINAANCAIRDEALKSGMARMASTIVLAAIFRGQVTIGHIGDSRAYLLRNGRIEQLTQDHTLVNMLVGDGKMSRFSAYMSGRKHVLTRSLGTTDYPKADILTRPLEQGDRLLLCTDGLYGVVTENQIARILKKHKKPADAAHQLIQVALDQCTSDNVSAAAFGNGEIPMIATRYPFPVLAGVSITFFLGLALGYLLHSTQSGFSGGIQLEPSVVAAGFTEQPPTVTPELPLQGVPILPGSTNTPQPPIATNLVAAVKLREGGSEAGEVQWRPPIKSTPILIPTVTDTATPIPATPAYPAVVIDSSVNVRTGPGVDYQLLRRAEPGEIYEIRGKSQSGDWWQINFHNQIGWVFADIVTAYNTKAVVVVTASPTFTPVATPTVTATPSPTVSPTVGSVQKLIGCKPSGVSSEAAGLRVIVNCVEILEQTEKGKQLRLQFTILNRADTPVNLQQSLATLAATDELGRVYKDFRPNSEWPATLGPDQQASGLIGTEGEIAVDSSRLTVTVTFIFEPPNQRNAEIQLEDINIP